MANHVQSSTAVLDTPVIAPGQNFETVTETIAQIPLSKRTPLGWVFGFLIGLTLLSGLMMSLSWLLLKGIGIWGNNVPVAWAFDIINFVWWIGIGHAGTLISAILLLFKQQWRMSISRFAEAMTIFAVLCAAIFPIFHTGRPWLAAYWLFPYPNTMGLWPQFRSPLIWDVFAVSTYATVSVVFWYVGLIPDLATMRDRATSRIKQIIFGFFSLGWRGSARHWHRYEVASLILAGLSTPLVLSVHTVVSFDFAVSVMPGWHATIFPPYFVAGAIYSGFAMVLSLAIPIRAAYGLQGLITMKHIDNMAKVMLATGLMVGYGYTMEAFFAWYSGSFYEKGMMYERMTGPYAWAYWTLIAINVGLVQSLWFRRVRMNLPLLFVISLVVNLGMWLERFVIIVTTLARDFVTSSWGMYYPTRWDFITYFGTIGLFLTLFFLFIRFVPMISIFEVRTLLPEAKVGHGQAHGLAHGAVGEDDDAALPYRGTPMHVNEPTNVTYGIMAEFDSAQTVVDAARRVVAEGYTKAEAYTPVPIEELNFILHKRRTFLPQISLVGGLAGMATGFALQYWASVIEYPFIVGGRPFASWPAFVIPSYELTILFSALATTIGMIALNGLPQPYHPVFNVPRFSLASSDKFFLVIEAVDPKFGMESASRLLHDIGAKGVYEVPA